MQKLIHTSLGIMAALTFTPAFAGTPLNSSIMGGDNYTESMPPVEAQASAPSRYDNQQASFSPLNSDIMGGDNYTESMPPVETQAQASALSQNDYQPVSVGSLNSSIMGGDNYTESMPPVETQTQASAPKQNDTNQAKSTDQNEKNAGAASGEPDRLNPRSPAFWYGREHR